MPEPALAVGVGTSVETEELRQLSHRLASIANRAAQLRARLLSVDEVSGTSSLRALSAPPSAFAAEGEIDRAAAALTNVEVHGQFGAAALRTAADGYEAAEAVARALFGAGIDGLGWAGGLLAPLALAPALGIGARLALASPEERNRFLSDPAVVGGIRVLVMGMDDVLLGRVGVPPGLAGLLGDSGLGVTGLSFAAAALATAGGAVGLLKESGVRVDGKTALPIGPPLVAAGPGIGARTAAPLGSAPPSAGGPVSGAPAGFADRYGRVPEPDALDGAQVIVERYNMPGGQQRFEVYIAGTVDFDPAAVGEPWDMASNVSNAVGPGSGSYDAVAAAMREAGIGADDPVQLTGYSQGGGTAAQLASSGEFRVEGLVTFGGPTGQVAVPQEVTTVIVEHDDDLVAALGGRQDNGHAVVVSRWATEGTNFAEAELLPGHRRPAYTETAHLMDVAADPRLAEAAATIGGFAADGVLVSRTAYTCERTISS